MAETAPAVMPSLTDSIGFSWRLVWKKPECILIFFVAGILGQIVAIPGGIVGGVLQVSHDRDAQIAGLIVRVAANLLNLPFAVFFTMGAVRYSLHLVRGEPAGFKDIFSWGPFFPYLGATLLVALGVLFGIAFCIIPGIFLGICWMFTGQNIMDRGLGPVEAMRASWDLTNGHRWDLLLLMLLLTGVNILGMLACCVGLFVTGAMTNLALAWVYFRLSGKETVAV